MTIREDVELLRGVLDSSEGEWDWNGPLPGALDRILGLVAAIPVDRLNPWHTVTVHETGWHMAHPIRCNLADCAFDGLAQAEWVVAPTAVGVWRWLNFEDEPWDWVSDNEPEA